MRYTFRWIIANLRIKISYELHRLGNKVASHSDVALVSNCSNVLDFIDNLDQYDDLIRNNLSLSTRDKAILAYKGFRQ